MSEIMTAQRLLEEYMTERHALGYVAETDEACIRRFLRHFHEPSDGCIAFTKEYVTSHIGHTLNQKPSTISREACAINGFMDFVIRKGFHAYKIPHKTLPKVYRNFKAYIFSDEEIERMLEAANNIPYTNQNPIRQYQMPVMYLILFNCGLRTSELLNLHVKDVNLEENILIVWETKFHKNRLVPFSDVVAEALTDYFAKVPPDSEDALLFRNHKACGKYTASGLNNHFRMLLRMAQIPYGGPGKGPRPHDIRHTFAVHCLNNWVLTGEDISIALPVLSRYMGHGGIKGTQKYLQLTAQMYPDMVSKLEERFAELIPQTGGEK